MLLEPRPRLAGDAQPLPIPLAWPLWCLCPGNKAAPRSGAAEGVATGFGRSREETRAQRTASEAQSLRLGLVAAPLPTGVRIALKASFSGRFQVPVGARARPSTSRSRAVCRLGAPSPTPISPPILPASLFCSFSLLPPQASFQGRNVFKPPFPIGNGPLSLGGTETQGRLLRGSPPPAFTDAHVGGGAETGKNLLH